jgi:hypothetical protein
MWLGRCGTPQNVSAPSKAWYFLQGESPCWVFLASKKYSIPEVKYVAPLFPYLEING